MDKLQNIVDNNEIIFYKNMIDWNNIDYSIIPLSIVNKNIDKINWDMFTTQYKLNESSIELYNENINWDLLDYNNLIFSENFISKFFNKIVWEKYLIHKSIHYDFLDKLCIFDDINNFKVYLIKNVVNNDILSKQLEYFLNKMNNNKITKKSINNLIDIICTYQRLNNDFINNFSHILNFKLLSIYQDLDDTIIINYFDKFHKHLLLNHQKLDINKYNDVYVKSILLLNEKFSTTILNKDFWYYQDNDDKMIDLYNNDFNIFEYDKDVNTVSIVDHDLDSSVCNEEETQENDNEETSENDNEETSENDGEETQEENNNDVEDNSSYVSSVENEEEVNNEYYINGYIFTINNSILIDNYILNTNLKDNMKLHTKLNLNYDKFNLNQDEDEIKIIYDNENNTKLSYNTVLNKNEENSYGNSLYYDNIDIFRTINQIFYGSYINMCYNEFYEIENSNLFGIYVFNEKQVNEILDLFKNSITDYDMFVNNIKIYNVLCNINDITMNDINNINFVRSSDIDIISEISIDNEINSIVENVDIIGDYLKDKYNCYSNLNTSNISIQDEVQQYLDVIPDIHSKLNINTIIETNKNDVSDTNSTNSDENQNFDKKTTTIIINDKTDVDDIENTDDDDNDDDYIENNKNSYSNILWSFLKLNN